MWLEMFISNMLIDRIELNYEGFVSTGERQAYQERWSEDLYFRHIRKIKLAMTDPVFFINNVPSKMNKPEFEEMEDVK